METKITSIKQPGYENVISFHNPKLNLKGFIAVHSTKLGPSLGGVRMRPYKNEEEALTDVLRLSKAMTYKATSVDLPLGGGKCVVFGNPLQDKTKELFVELGKVIDTLNGSYLAAEDSGTSIQDMKWIHQSTPHVTGTNREGDPSPVTALGVFQGIATYLEVALNIRTLKGVKIAIQGVGNVGFPLAEKLFKSGAELTVCDPNPDNLARAQKKLVVKVVAPEKILEQPVDVFTPCAYGGVLNPENIARLNCKIVAGAANNQFLDEEKDPKRLHDRGIWHAPDYINNAGGIINLFCEHHKEIHKLMPRMAMIPKRLREVLAIAQKENKAPLYVANALVEKILRTNKSEATSQRC